MVAGKAALRRVIVMVDGSPADEAVVEMACALARERRAQLYLVRTIMVDRTLPLDAPLTEATEQARAVLEQAKRQAEQHGCQAQVRELRTRNVAAALVDEAADLGCDQIVLAVPGEHRVGSAAFAIAEQILRDAPCPVWLYSFHHKR